MTFFEIDKSKPVPSLSLELAKPNEEVIGVLTEAYNRSGTLQFGQYNEIQITIPKYVTRRHKRVINKNYLNIRERYLVEAKYGNLFSEWMIITKIKNIKDENNMPIKQVSLRSRQYELNDKRIRNYEVESYTPLQVMQEILQYTNWSIGTINIELATLRRAFDETNISVLNMLMKIAETFNGVLVFDTYQRTVSLEKRENVEIDFGLSLSYGRYIKTVEQDSDAEEMVTRLYVYGKDDLSINEVNPTGASYIEDFSYFMQGYKTDENNNVVSSSPYMSDGLCQAILDYNELLNQKEGVFNTLLEERKPIQEEIDLRTAELYNLEFELATIEDQLDVAKAAGEDTGNLNIQRAQKLFQIGLKRQEIENLEIELTLIENDIMDLRDEISIENNFTPEQIKERNDFIIEAEWSDRNYFEADELYKAGKEKLKKLKEPKKELEFTSVQFLEIVEAQRDWDKIGLGYVVYVDYEPLDIEFKAIISELKIDFDDRKLNISISNVEYKSSANRFVDTLYNTAISTSQKVNMNSIKWNETANKTVEMEEILQGEWDAAKRRIVAGVNESVDISGRGIIIKNPEFPNEMIIVQSGVIALSEDGGDTWKTAIKPNGIISERLVGRILAGQQLTIENESGTFIVDSDGVSIIDANIAITTNNGNSRIIINPIDGIRMQKRVGSNWINNFYADLDGDLNISGNLTIGGMDNSNGVLRLLNSQGNNIITMNQNGIELNNGATLIGNGGVLSTFSFVSSGADNGWQMGGFRDGPYTDWLQPSIRFQIPDNFTITNALIYVYSMPLRIEGWQLEGIPDGYYHMRDIGLYKLNQFHNMYYLYPMDSDVFGIHYRPNSYSEITNQVWGGTWDPQSEGNVQNTKVKSGIITNYINNGYNEFFVMSKSSLESQSNASMFQIMVTVQGYQN